jgi:hypothetical protein
MMMGRADGVVKRAAAGVESRATPAARVRLVIVTGGVFTARGLEGEVKCSSGSVMSVMTEVDDEIEVAGCRVQVVCDGAMQRTSSANGEGGARNSLQHTTNYRELANLRRDLE